MIHYRRTQASWPAIIPLAAMMLILGVVFIRAQLTGPLVIVVGTTAVILLLFGTMTVIVDDTAIQARFGIGLVHKRVPFDHVRATAVVRNPWYYGWGIHFIPGGLLYNASGLSAVELQLTNGRVVRIGTDDPEALAAAVRRIAPAVGQDAEANADSNTGLPLVVLGIIVGVIAVAAFAIYAGMQPPAVAFASDVFSVRNGPYSSTVALRRIESATLDDAIPRVRGKTNGFEAGETLRGSFLVDGWGSTRLYVNKNHPPFVIIRTDDGYVAVNFADPARTRDLYAQLRQAIERSR